MSNQRSLPSPSSDHEVIPALDGLRGLACLLVVYAHQGGGGGAFTLGAIGVMLFFILSGFLMSFLYFPDPVEQVGFNYWGKFLIRRFFRIYPAYAFYIFVSWFIGPWFAPPDLHDRLLLLNGYGYWWTIPVEIRFYLLFPIIASTGLFVPDHPVFRITVLLGVWCALLIASINYRFPIILSPPWNTYNFFFGLPHYFLAGATAGYIYRCYRNRLRRFVILWNLMAAIFLAIIVSLTVAGFPFRLGLTRNNWWLYPVGLSLMITAGTMVCALADNAACYVLTNPVTRFLGRISYSLFLVHPLVIAWTNKCCTHPDRALLIWVWSIVIAAHSYCLIEKPGRWFGVWLSRKLPTTASGL